MGCACSAPNRGNETTRRTRSTAFGNRSNTIPKEGDDSQRSARNGGEGDTKISEEYHHDSINLQPTKGGSMLLDSKGKAAIMEQQAPPLATMATAIPLLWQPGTAITRPSDTRETQLTYIPTSDGRYLRLCYGAMSHQGYTTRRSGKVNQDSWIIAPSLRGDPQSFLMAVFDGHGPKGEDASHYCAVHLATLLQAQPDFQYDPFHALRSSFEPLHQGYIRSAAAAQKAGLHADPNVSGTAAITVFIQGNKFACANVGDSRAVMFLEPQSTADATKTASVAADTKRTAETSPVSMSKHVNQDGQQASNRSSDTTLTDRKSVV